jgi:hypothetical protein
LSGTLNYLFEKVFFQAAHIAILEEAIDTIEKDIINLSEKHPGLDIGNMLAKLSVAHESIAKLKKGSSK